VISWVKLHRAYLGYGTSSGTKYNIETKYCRIRKTILIRMLSLNIKKWRRWPSQDNRHGQLQTLSVSQAQFFCKKIAISSYTILIKYCKVSPVKLKKCDNFYYIMRVRMNTLINRVALFKVYCKPTKPQKVSKL